jgi:hypothetical protein
MAQPTTWNFKRMQFRLKTNPYVIAIAGTWDPPLPRHISLFKELSRYSKKRALNPYVLIFYPNPLNYRHQNKYKDYFDLDARIELCRRWGLNNVVVADFSREDLELAVGDFFDQLAQNTGIVLTELWMGENQSLGGGSQGFNTSRNECLARNIKLRILKNSFLVNLDKDSIYRDFNAGKFEVVAAITGYYPTYKLKEDALINMNDGLYKAKLRTDPFSNTNELAVTIKITEGHLAAMERPGGHHWLILLERVEQGEP